MHHTYFYLISALPAISWKAIALLFAIAFTRNTCIAAQIQTLQFLTDVSHFCVPFIETFHSFSASPRLAFDFVPVLRLLPVPAVL